MPASQAMLLWIKDAAPKVFRDVLALARTYDQTWTTAEKP
jgi:hypothetical protein